MEGGNNSSSKFIVSKATLHKLKPQAYSLHLGGTAQNHISMLKKSVCGGLWQPARQAKKLTIWHFFRGESFFGRGDCLHCNLWPKGQCCCENSMGSVTIFATPLCFEGHCHSAFHWRFPVSQLQNPELLMVTFHSQVFQN